MTIIKATVKDRRLELDVPPDWPDGTEVEIHPLDGGANGDSDVMSPTEIARMLTAMDQIEPFDMTDAELAAWEAERRTRREEEKARFAVHLESLGKLWE